MRRISDFSKARVFKLTDAAIHRSRTWYAARPWIRRLGGAMTRQLRYHGAFVYRLHTACQAAKGLKGPLNAQNP
jgi:hypothetical protein